MCPSNVVLLFTVLIVCFEVFGVPVNDLNEGSACENENDDDYWRTKRNQKGVCVKVTDCPSARTALRSRRSHGLMRCGFDRYMEIVCCPQTDLQVTTSRYTSSKEAEDYPTSKTTPRSKQTTTSSRKETRKPDVDEAEVRHAKRKSEQACEEFSNEVPPSVTFQILGGENAQLGEFPHMVAIGYKGEEENVMWKCGGSLISNAYVLTAAHCIIRQGGEEPVKVRLGKIDLQGNSDQVQPHDYNIENYTVHPKYSRRTKYNDIALLKLSSRVASTDYMHPACLYNKNDDPTPLVVTGWGYTSVGQDNSDILQKATLNSVSVSNCNTTYVKRLNKEILRTQMCAMSEDGSKDACQGDSGGPLQFQQKRTSSVYSIVGVTSYGTGCGGKSPGVYTRVYSYLDWIESIVWPE